MIALDTNVLIRLIAQDDVAQAKLVHDLFRTARENSVALLVTDIVLGELSWVLSSRYRFRRDEIALALENLLAMDWVVVSDCGAVERAVAAYAAGPGGFSDYLIRERALTAGATEVVTFNRALRHGPGFRVLGR